MTAEFFSQRLDTILTALCRLQGDVQETREKLLSDVINPADRELRRLEALLREIAAMREH